MKYIKDIVIIDNISVICCNNKTKSDETIVNNVLHGDLGKSDSSFLSAIDDMDIENVSDPKDILIAYLKDLLKHKNALIKQLEENNLLLKTLLHREPSMQQTNKSFFSSRNEPCDISTDPRNSQCCTNFVNETCTETSTNTSNSSAVQHPKVRQPNQQRSQSANYDNINKRNPPINEKKIIGTLSTDGSVSISGMNWIFASKYATTYTKEKLKDHLDCYFPNNSFIVEEMPFKEKYHYKSFKIGVDKKALDNLLCEDIWPQGVEVSEFQFFQKINRFKNKQHHRKFQQARRS